MEAAYDSVTPAERARLRFLVLSVLATVAILLTIFFQGFGYDLLAHPLVFAGVCLGFGLIASSFILSVSLVSCVSEEVMYLAAELAHEAGTTAGDLSDGLTSIKELLGFYQKALHHRAFGRVIVPLLSITRALHRTDKALSPPFFGTTKDSVRQLGIALAHQCETITERHFGFLFIFRPAARFVRADPNLVELANQAMEEFHSAVGELNDVPSFALAHRVCLLSRRAGGRIHCAWSEYLSVSGRTPTLSRFKTALASGTEAVNKLADELQGPDACLLKEYALSMKRRRRAFEALLANDRGTLWQTLQEAVSESENRGGISASHQAGIRG